MGTEYKFLILEDVETDAELIMDQVRVADIVCNFKYTDNEVDFKRLIDEFKPDLILSDYSLPTYDGMTALKYVLEHSPDIPVIVVTGSLNEETAVECMKTGAVDYILKDKMNRLGLAVVSALENKKVKIEKRKDQKQIKENLKEKELLLQEIYHRVNNNMQIMISLFNMQIERSELQAEKDVLAIAQTRVGAMSVIHNDIYQERSFTAINFRNVISHIFSNLCDSFMVLCGNIELHIEADVPSFGLDLAQPSALIVSELMANCIRHAYPQGKGPVYVSLSEDESDEITLLVKDNGVGIPESIVPEDSDTTGFRLVYLLAAGQLGGTVAFYRDNGTTVEIKFKRIEDKKRF